MDKEDIIIDMIKDFKNDNNERFDKLENDNNKRFDKLENEINEIKDNHIKHLIEDVNELKGSFNVIKPIGYTIAGGVVLAVIKYLFFP
ncbi:MAG: conserved hypothetical protein [Methanobrevibacter sp. CfCl-M3]